jgi:hypothetical protein
MKQWAVQFQQQLKSDEQSVLSRTVDRAVKL